MIVDDDVDDRSFFRDAIRTINPLYKSMEAEHGEDALLQLKNRTQLPDYIFLDLNMPVMNGIEFLSQLSKEPLLKDIPVIVYTTSVSPSDMNATKDLGAKYYLPKSADLSKLPSKILFAIDMVDATAVK